MRNSLTIGFGTFRRSKLKHGEWIGGLNVNWFPILETNWQSKFSQQTAVFIDIGQCQQWNLPFLRGLWSFLQVWHAQQRHLPQILVISLGLTGSPSSHSPFRIAEENHRKKSHPPRRNLAPKTSRIDENPQIMNYADLRDQWLVKYRLFVVTIRQPEQVCTLFIPKLMRVQVGQVISVAKFGNPSARTVQEHHYTHCTRFREFGHWAGQCQNKKAQG